MSFAVLVVVVVLTSVACSVLGPDPVGSSAGALSDTPRSNPQRTGVYETTITLAQARTMARGPSYAVDGLVYAQPLVVENVTMPDNTTKNILLVATTKNHLYAFDADVFGSELWELGPSAAIGTFPHFGFAPNMGDSGYEAPGQQVDCSNIGFTGIISTPYVELRGGAGTYTAYVVSQSRDNATTDATPQIPSAPPYHHDLFAIDVATGTFLLPPVRIAATASGFNGSTIQLNEQNGVTFPQPNAGRRYLCREHRAVSNPANGPHERPDD